LYYFKKKEENLQNDFYIADWNGYSRGSIPLASHCLSSLKIKNEYRFLVAWTLFNTFLTPGKLTDLAQTKPSKFKKKGCENTSFLSISHY